MQQYLCVKHYFAVNLYRPGRAYVDIRYASFLCITAFMYVHLTMPLRNLCIASVQVHCMHYVACIAILAVIYRGCSIDTTLLRGLRHRLGVELSRSK